MEHDNLITAAQEWIAGDPDPDTRAELEAIVASGDVDALNERMGAILRFGTAGIRGAVGAGSNRMNRAMVIRATKGVADYLNAERPGTGPVVVGRDARLSSAQFMDDTVGVLAAAGIPVRYFAGLAPTPLVAYAARTMDASAAVVVTASHNPPQDNGYKVYDANAAQIVPPVDGMIAAAIDLSGPASEIPRADVAAAGVDAEPIGESMEDEYIAEVIGRLPRIAVDHDLRIVYTPMHGVGRDLFVKTLAAAGFAGVYPVPEQAAPDGRFPTVAFPNPEEPGALDLALSLAAELDADLVLANDPDADRLAVSVPDGAGGWLALTGNQIGILLADHILRTDEGGPQALVANSIVSSPMLASVAGAYGAEFTQTLTGFKWISNAALDLSEDQGLRFLFGYEEALGYSVGPVVRDKDGIGAGVWFAHLVGSLRADGKSVLDRLQDLYRRHGLWVSTQKSIVRPGAEGAEEIASAMDLLREHLPEALGGFKVVSATDYRDGAEQRARWLPAQALVEFDLGEAGRALVRPSGTEPKLKIYVDLKVDLGAGDPRVAEADALVDAADIAADLMEFLGIA
ncbi:phospho-sugar mutase [bacterium]|nr:phospho-sugar mutase [bacterium]